MKLYYLFFLSILFSFISTEAQGQSEYKYGKISNEELEMKIYPKDSSAKAVVLYEDAYTGYIYRDGFAVQSEMKCRIKILKQEGADKATISIPIYKRGRVEESLSGIEAYSYNLENGKIVKTKLEKNNIFEEKITDNVYQTKLAIPNAKAGSIIEYKYTLFSPFYYDISDFYFQRDIPVQQSKLEIVIPEYFTYKKNTKGFEPIDLKEKDESQTLTVAYGGESHLVNFHSKDYVFSVKDMPALTSDDYVWEISDFMSGVHFELSGTNYPGEFYKPFNSDWNSIEKTIKEETDFVKNIQRSVPWKDELAQIKTLPSEMDKMNAVYALVKGKISWNGKYAFTGNFNDALKSGTGDNAQINGALISSLNQVGIKAFPVLLRRRSEGRLPIAIPSFYKISTFIVAAQFADTTLHIMDGSAKYGGPDMLPSDLLVDRARTFDLDSPNNDFIDLSRTNKNQEMVINIANLSDDGSLNVKCTEYHKMQLAYKFRSDYAAAKDSAEFVEKYETNNKVKVENMAISGHKNNLANTVKEEIEYTTQATKRGDFIYINPLIIPQLTKNDFTQSDRKTPVEFSYPYTYQITSTIFIPKGYAVEELPKSTRLTLENKEGALQYSISAQQDGVIQVSYRFQLNDVIFPYTNYPMLREFFGTVATKNTEMIVLKKI